MANLWANALYCLLAMRLLKRGYFSGKDRHKNAKDIREVAGVTRGIRAQPQVEVRAEVALGFPIAKEYSSPRNTRRAGRRERCSGARGASAAAWVRPLNRLVARRHECGRALQPFDSARSVAAGGKPVPLGDPSARRRGKVAPPTLVYSGGWWR